MTHSRKLAGMIACCAAALAVIAGPASARQIFQERYEGEVTLQYENFCGAEGLTVSDEVVYAGQVKAVQRGRDGFEYFLDHIKETELFTNVADGKTITAVLKYNVKDPLRVTNNRDGTLTIHTLLTGSTMIYGADGKAIARSTGLSRSETLVDHGGTPRDPSDDEVIAELGPVQRSGRSDDTCAAAVEALT